jgi:ribosomal protein S18 acetylase RimI-like enzyme
MDIREMREEDLDKVVEVHYARFADYRASQLGPAFVRRLYQWFLETHPEYALVAVTKNGVVGFIVGAEGSYSQALLRFTFWHILWGLLTHPGLVFNPKTYLGWRVFSQALLPGAHRTPKPANPSPSSGGLCVVFASVAVLESARGLGGYLVLALERVARQKGATKVRASVKMENKGVIRLFESVKWQTVEDPAHGVVYQHKNLQ